LGDLPDCKCLGPTGLYSGSPDNKYLFKSGSYRYIEEIRSDFSERISSAPLTILPPGAEGIPEQILQVAIILKARLSPAARQSLRPASCRSGCAEKDNVRVAIGICDEYEVPRLLARRHIAQSGGITRSDLRDIQCRRRSGITVRGSPSHFVRQRNTAFILRFNATCSTINTWLRLAVDDCCSQRRGETRSDFQRYKNGRVVGYSTHN
jgi:hypothetical protein